MPECRYHNRRAFLIENDALQVTVLVEGGHVASILHKPSGVNPLWTPPWPTIEPSTYTLSTHPEYGTDAESQLLSGIMGHNLCLDLFGPPSPEEAAAGLTVHGEASLLTYSLSDQDGALVQRLRMPMAQLAVERRIRLAPDGSIGGGTSGTSGTTGVILFTETVENLAALDRPLAWTQHVTLGPPFLERGRTLFRAPATRSRILGGSGADFDWPMLPTPDGAQEDLRIYTSAESSGGFTTHLMDPRREQAFFLAWSPSTQVLFGYVWKQADFPWLGIWEENHSRTGPPWNGVTLTRGMEFGASPMPEPRRAMIDRHSLFGVPAYRWIPARQRVRVDYCAFIATAGSIPDEVVWDHPAGGRVAW